MSKPHLLTLHHGPDTTFSASIDVPTRSLHHIHFPPTDTDLRDTLITLAVITGQIELELEKRHRATAAPIHPIVTAP